jgi:hypothetical protein
VAAATVYLRGKGLQTTPAAVGSLLERQRLLAVRSGPPEAAFADDGPPDGEGEGGGGWEDVPDYEYTLADTPQGLLLPPADGPPQLDAVIGRCFDAALRSLTVGAARKAAARRRWQIAPTPLNVALLMKGRCPLIGRIRHGIDRVILTVGLVPEPESAEPAA